MSRAPLRSAGLRPSRPGQAAAPLESQAAEFALLAQRAARIGRQLALLDRQRLAAAATLRQVEARMAVLSRRMALGAPPAAGPDAPEAAPRPRARRGLVLEY